jgi:hypothetical protein
MLLYFFPQVANCPLKRPLRGTDGWAEPSDLSGQVHNRMQARAHEVYPRWFAVTVYNLKFLRKRK